MSSPIKCIVPIVIQARLLDDDGMKQGISMSIQEVKPERFAESFHHFFQALAQDFGCAERPSREAWDRVSPQERSCLVAATRLALLEVASEIVAEQETRQPESERRRYFAKPGKAEWGC